MLLASWKPLALLVWLMPAALAPLSRDHGSRKAEVVVVDGDDLASVDGDEPVVLRIGEGHRGFIGVRPIEMTPELREHFGAPRDAGVLVGQVELDSPAAKAGLRVGDIVTSAGGERVDSVRDLTRAVRGKNAGDSVELEVVRDRTTRRLPVSVAERENRDWDLGDLPSFDRKTFRMPDLEPKIRARIEGLHGLEGRLHDLEKRLQDLEKRLPSR